MVKVMPFMQWPSGHTQEGGNLTVGPPVSEEFNLLSPASQESALNTCLLAALQERNLEFWSLLLHFTLGRSLILKKPRNTAESGDWDSGPTLPSLLSIPPLQSLLPLICSS